MLKKCLRFYDQYKAMILYLFFGGLSTIVNILAYYVAAYLFGCSVVVSTMIAWIAAVLFAYVTNKLWVFASKQSTAFNLIKEFFSFIAARVFSGALDVGFMFFFVDILHINDILIKILSNVVVVILNYIFSKYWIFKSK